MKFLTYLTRVLIILLIISCKNTTQEISILIPKKSTIGDDITLTIRFSNQQSQHNKIELYVGSKKLALNKNTAVVKSADIGVGKHEVTALIFSENKVKKVKNYLNIYANTKPKAYNYEIVNIYTHDKKAYTQGLEFNKGHLYETTGRIGTSWLRKIEYKTGKVLQEYKLQNYFGEGMSIIEDSIYWLTWQGTRGFIYDINSFDQKGSFKYNKSLEGWGLTHDHKNNLIKSDGTHKLYQLDEQGNEIKTIQVTSNNAYIDKLNELEYANGKIYANRWITKMPVKSIIIIIDAQTGIVNGVLDLAKLREDVAQEQKLGVDEVLNGIAYNSQTDTFFVTGKHWGKIFEIKIKE